MITLKLQIENPAILTPLKEVLKAINGVRLVDSNDQPIQVEDEPNSVTLEAMSEAKEGNDAGSVNLKDIEGFIASLS